MRSVVFFFGLFLLSGTLSAQYVYTIKADSVKLTNCDSSELIIENHTQNVPGFLFNTGNGRTVFKRGVVKINGGLYLIGADTLNVGANAWVQGGNAFGTTGVLGTLDNNHLDFYTADTRWLRLTNTGNLLVGTMTDNGSKLQVNGSINQAYNNITSFGNGLYFDIAPYNAVSTSRIFSSGEIAYQSNYSGDQHIFENSIGTGLKGTLVTLDPGAYNLLPDSQLTIKVLGRSGNLGLVVNMLGNTGLGTLYPSAQLHTTGTVRFAGLTSDTTKTRVLVSDANGNLYYRDASTLAANGIVNADLANGSAILPSLAVNGTIFAQRLKLSQTGWPDYVFARNYDLPKLNEIEEYIQQHGHLPGIPSAAEVEKKGIDVGDHQAALLKKIEELTLYTIEQNKKLAAQGEELDELKKEMVELKKIITGGPLK